MKKQTVELRVVPGLSPGLTFRGQYLDKRTNKTVTLLLDGTVKDTELEPNERMMKFDFSVNNNVLRYNWDWSSDTSTEAVVIKQKAIKEFILNHPEVKSFGYDNKNLREALFQLTVKEDMEEMDYALTILKGNVFNIVNAMSFEEQRDIAFYFGLNPTGKTDKQVFISLVNFNTGILMSVENSNKLISIKKGGENSDLSLRVLIKKAIALNIVETKEGKFYSQNGELIGLKEEDVVAYFKSNIEMKSFLEKEVLAKDAIPNNSEKISNEKVLKSSKKDYDKMNDNEIMEEAKNNKLVDWYNRTPADLLSELKEKH